MLVRSSWLTVLLTSYMSFPTHCSINYWERSVEISNYYCWIVYFFYQFHQFLLYVVLGCPVRCIYIYNCYFLILTFISLWKFPYLSLVIFLYLKVYFVWSIATSALLWLLFVWDIFSHLFTFNLFMFLNLWCVCH